MKLWRMAFRCGNNGPSLWDECRKHGLAVIQYNAVDDVDLSKYQATELPETWKKLASQQKSSLKRFAFEMSLGDTIYVKEGKDVIAKGVVVGPYKYRERCPIRGTEGEPWQHTRRVQWDPSFVPTQIQIGRTQLSTVDVLSLRDISKLERQVIEEQETRPRRRFADESDIEGIRSEYTATRTSRSRKLRDKAFALADGVCAVCQFDYGQVLGGDGVRVLQVHHKNPVSQNKGPTVTNLNDLVVVCANCHLLLHLDTKKVLDVPKLRKMLRDQGYLRGHE